MTLPKMDVPVNVVEWELFVPDRFRVDRFDGDMFDAGLMTTHVRGRRGSRQRRSAASGGGRGAAAAASAAMSPLAAAQPGQINGRVVDASGAAIPGATVDRRRGRPAPERGHRRERIVRRLQPADRHRHADGAVVRVHGVAPRGAVRPARPAGRHDAGGRRCQETVTVTAETPTIETSTARMYNNAGVSNANARQQQAREGPAGRAAVGERPEPAAPRLGRAAGADGGPARRHAPTGSSGRW